MIRTIYSVLTLCIALVVFVAVGDSMLSKNDAPLISPLPDEERILGRSQNISELNTPTVMTQPSPPPTPVSSLASVITNSLSGTKGTYAIVVKHVDRNEMYSYNADREYPTASLYKLWVMATTFREIEKGTLSLDEQLSSSIAELNSAFNISPEYAELTEGTISLTVSQALSQMITISHNYAALLLTKRIGVSSIDEFLTEHNFSQSRTGEPPVSTARDIFHFYESLINETLVGHEYSTSMIDLLKNQQRNEKLPKYLPKTVKVAHKTGELDYLSHDAGIVFGENGPYIIVVLSESNNPSAANERIASVSKVVYDYFER